MPLFSVAEIGQRVGLSSTPCWKRIQRLEAERRDPQKRVAIVDQSKVGLGIHRVCFGRDRRPFGKLAGQFRIDTSARCRK